MSHSINIPKEDREQIKKWLVEGEDPADKILEALRDAQPSLQRSVLARAVTQAIQGNSAVVNQVLRIYFTVLRTVRLGEDLDEMISAVYQAAVSHEPTDAEKFKNFSRRVHRLLSLRSLVITSKAAGVMVGNANTFCRARTISEVRPVFTEGDALKPEAAIIVHQLNIVFHSGPKLDENEFFVTLDSEDLIALKNVVDRALRKDKEIVGVLREGIHLLVENST
jgi:hypothetical protein